MEIDRQGLEASKASRSLPIGTWVFVPREPFSSLLAVIRSFPSFLFLHFTLNRGSMGQLSGEKDHCTISFVRRHIWSQYTASTVAHPGRSNHRPCSTGIVARVAPGWPGPKSDIMSSCTVPSMYLYRCQSKPRDFATAQSRGYRSIHVCTLQMNE